MSFYVNNTSLNMITFNEANANSIYYNGRLVWGAPITLTWQQIYNYCKQKQNGEIETFPSSIYLGMEMIIPLRDDLTGNIKTVKARLVDIETEGTGVLVFQQCSSAQKASGYYMNLASHSMNSFSQYVKPLNKVGSYYDSYESGFMSGESLFYTVNESKFWRLSAQEIGETNNSIVRDPDNIFTSIDFQEYTEGITTPYSYLTVPEHRICYDVNGESTKYLLRSKVGAQTTNYHDLHYYVDMDGSFKGGSSPLANGLDEFWNGPDFHCFAIG